MSRNKFFAAGLAFSLLLYGLAQPGRVYAASPTLSASADTGSVKAGDYVNINVDLSNNPDISTFGAALNYDSSVLQYDSSTWSGNFTESDMQMASDTGSEVNLSVVCDDSYSADGTVVTVRFQAVQDSDSIPVGLSLRDMADADLSEVADCAVADTVSAPQTPQTPQTPPESDESDLVDTDNLEDTSEISIVDEQVQPDDPQKDDVPDTGNTDGTSAGQTGNYSNTSGSPQASAKSSRLDANYKTGNGLGSDWLLVGAAACGISAIVFGIRRSKK